MLDLGWHNHDFPSCSRIHSTLPLRSRKKSADAMVRMIYEDDSGGLSGQEKWRGGGALRGTDSGIGAPARD